MRKTIAGALATLALIAGTVTTAGIADAAPARKAGTFKNAANLWLSIDAGKKGRERDGDFNRRSLCKYAGRYGGTKSVAVEAVTDVAYDAYSNHGQVTRWAAAVAVLDCASMGYKIK